MQEKAERQFQAAIHGIEVDTADGLTDGTGPAPGRGTDAWQQALKIGLQINARRRRN